MKIKPLLIAGAIALSPLSANAGWSDFTDWVKDRVDDAEDAFEDAFENVVDFFDSASQVVGQAEALVISTVSNIVDGQDLSPDKKITEFQNSWTWKALKHQRRLEQNIPLSQASMLGSHNTYNSEEYTGFSSYLDPQHKHTIYDQLRLGISFIELDAHWTSHSYDLPEIKEDILLCHSGIGAEFVNWHVGCSLKDRRFTSGLREIRNWLSDPDNGDEVVIMYIEDYTDGHHRELYDKLTSVIGPYIYHSGGCGPIPDTLTKADVLKAGKQIIIRKDDPQDRNEPDGCSDHSGLANMVYTSMGNVSRTWEDGTGLADIISAAGGDVKEDINATDIINDQLNGKNLINLDNITYNDGRLSAAVWSWNQGEPNSASDAEDCAMMRSDGRWNDRNCAHTLKYACQHQTTGEWRVTAAQGPWEQSLAEQFCDDEFGAEFDFDVPMSSPENHALNQAKEAQDIVWLDYNDQENEKLWVANGQKPVMLNFRLLRNMRTGSCLDLDEPRNGEGLEVVRCNGNPRQRWLYANAFFVNALGKCMDNSGDQHDDDYNIGVWSCVNHDNLRWDWNGMTIRPRNDHNYAVDVQGSGVENLDIEHVWANPENPDQQFVWTEFYDVSDLSRDGRQHEYRSLVNQNSTRCMVVKNGVIADQQNVVLGECLNVNHALWRFDEATQTLRVKSNDNYCLAHGNADDAFHNGKVVINRCVSNNNHKWVLDGKRILNKHNENISIGISGDDNGDNVRQSGNSENDGQYWRWLSF